MSDLVHIFDWLSSSLIHARERRSSSLVHTIDWFSSSMDWFSSTFKFILYKRATYVVICGSSFISACFLVKHSCDKRGEPFISFTALIATSIFLIVQAILVYVVAKTAPLITNGSSARERFILTVTDAFLLYGFGWGLIALNHFYKSDRYLVLLTISYSYFIAGLSILACWVHGFSVSIAVMECAFTLTLDFEKGGENIYLGLVVFFLGLFLIAVRHNYFRMIQLISNPPLPVSASSSSSTSVSTDQARAPPSQLPPQHPNRSNPSSNRPNPPTTHHSDAPLTQSDSDPESSYHSTASTAPSPRPNTSRYRLRRFSSTHQSY